MSHEASRTGAPIVALNIIEGLRTKYNVVAIMLGWRHCRQLQKDRDGDRRADRSQIPAAARGASAGARSLRDVPPALCDRGQHLVARGVGAIQPGQRGGGSPRARIRLLHQALDHLYAAIDGHRSSTPPSSCRTAPCTNSRPWHRAACTSRRRAGSIPSRSRRG